MQGRKNILLKTEMGSFSPSLSSCFRKRGGALKEREKKSS